MIHQARRAILIVLDGVGLGALPDAAIYGDQGAATLPHVAQACHGLTLPNLQKLGLGNLAAISGVPKNRHALAGFGRMRELGEGKDSTTGHWELSGVILKKPFATYPNGFPQALVKQFAEAVGIEPIGNIPASGLSILKKFGPQHLQTGRPILYTSVDSVFQVAAYEEIIPVERLYEICCKARLLADPYRIGRVIARPFIGSEKEGFRRTSRRKDFSMPPPAETILDRLHAHGLPTLGIGKIGDLFAGRGLTFSESTENNDDGMLKTLRRFSSLSHGFLMVNLIDFDMSYGHRKDAIGFGRALEEFDSWLPKLLNLMTPNDFLII